MTIDPFTDAARAEGQARIAAMLEVSGASDDIRAWFPAGFEKGAEWARTHLAQQATTHARKAKTCPTCHGDVHVDLAGDIWTTTNAPTDAEVEAAANAIIALVPGETEATAHMDDIDDAWDHARAALTAARAARRDEEKR